MDSIVAVQKIHGDEDAVLELIRRMRMSHRPCQSHSGRMGADGLLTLVPWHERLDVSDPVALAPGR
eukprot:2559041-Pyramimonas_sp.AAC.1